MQGIESGISADISLSAIPDESEPGNQEEQGMVYVAASGTPNPEKCPGHRGIAADISLPAIPGESEPGNQEEQGMVYVAASGTPNPEKCPGHRGMSADISLPAIPDESEPGNPKEQGNGICGPAEECPNRKNCPANRRYICRGLLHRQFPMSRGRKPGRTG